MTQEFPTYDLIVIGAGIAGLTAAATAAENGLDVCLIEKQPSIGGSSKMSGGWFAFSETPEQQQAGVEDSDELFREDLLSVGKHFNDVELVDAYIANQTAAYNWLKTMGIEFKALEISSGQSVPRGHLSDIQGMLHDLLTAYSEAGGDTLYSATAQRLVTTGERVTGVEILHEHCSKKLTSRYGVLLCSGGFSRSKDMLSRFAPQQLAAIPFGGHGNTGDGHRMAIKLGAGLTDMSFISATYGSHPDTNDQEHELLTAYYLGAIIVNQHGKRFIDESQSYKTLGAAVLQQPEGLGHQIFDSKVRAQSQAGVPLMDMERLETLGHLEQADSLDELAKALGIPETALIDTVERYNHSGVEKGQDEMGRSSLCNGAGSLVRIDSPPFYAYPAKALMTSTYCGLQVDPEGHVIDVFGEKIEGLYAAGEIVGGFHGAAYMTGTSLGKGLVFGHHIAKNIATNAHATQVARA